MTAFPVVGVDAGVCTACGPSDRGGATFDEAADVAVVGIGCGWGGLFGGVVAVGWWFNATKKMAPTAKAPTMEATNERVLIFIRPKLQIGLQVARVQGQYLTLLVPKCLEVGRGRRTRRSGACIRDPSFPGGPSAPPYPFRLIYFFSRISITGTSALGFTCGSMKAIRFLSGPYSSRARQITSEPSWRNWE